MFPSYAIAKLFAVFFLVILISGCRPSDYDDCILENMQGVTSDRAASLVYRSCREKFPKQVVTPRTKPLSPDELVKLTGRAGLSFDNYFSGDLYNGNSDITVRTVTFYVGTGDGDDMVRREYVDDVIIPPMTTASFGSRIIVGDKGDNYSWGIVAAEGSSE